ncbi:MAG TPA: polyprenyl diphosphate synthase [Acidobacteriota bacterium]|nr:polyprenyl diphosphate synthase [Acidobacteriota bacterium]HRR56856.1 polyprenyl diphosphate synthase [Acidobacteriota bacterium]HRV08030.1 polyprenyl diphosphate synthase [Acidobacteriota bacterium]
MVDLLKSFQGVVEPRSAEEVLLLRLDPDRLPRHVAVIMDGNGRWACRRGLPRVEGHRAGIEAVRSIFEYSARLEIPVLTLYAFSTENWKRPPEEVNTLWRLLLNYLDQELERLCSHGVRFRPIGRLDGLPPDVRQALSKAEEVTRLNRRMTLVVALNYSGRLEIVDAVNRLLEAGFQAPIDKDTLESRLYTAGLPDPDLLIRTGGELRVSNFLLWQIAYAEFYVSEVLWPDFRGLHYLEALIAFQQRERRFGSIPKVSSSSIGS